MSVLDKDKNPLTLEQVMAEVNKGIEAKLSTKFDDFTTKKLPELLTGQLKPLNDQFTTLSDAIKALAVPAVPPKDPKDSVNDPNTNAALRQLNETVKNQGGIISQLQKDKEEATKKAETTERHSAIRTALSSLTDEGLHFVNANAVQTAFGVIEPHVKRLSDESLVATINGENFPIGSFSKDFLEKEHPYLFKASGSSGSGAPANQGGGSRMGAKVDIGVIKPGMKPEDRAAVLAAIGTAMQEANA